jgi:uncharacterized DUF497 family protein
MLFAWDPVKAEENLKKHRVSFEIAQTVFDDPLHLSILDDNQQNEERWITVGRAVNGSNLVVVHTYTITTDNTEMVRLISARKATRKEIRYYEERI